MFLDSHKKKIPMFPKTIGVLTSETGAVIRDIINVSTRRNPNVHIKLLPVPVQGEGAAIKIAKGIELMNKNNLADVLIIGRGGGSLEDLWPFNEEVVADAIYNSKIPIISAVGHETDFTIADFVADLRAPTPSAAAELAVPDILELKDKIKKYRRALRHSLLKSVQYQYLKVDSLIKNLVSEINKKVKLKRSAFSELVAKLDALSPLKTINRGFIVAQKDDKVVKSAKELKKGDNIKLRFSDGEKNAVIGG